MAVTTKPKQQHPKSSLGAMPTLSLPASIDWALEKTAVTDPLRGMEIWTKISAS
jgi:hypothetical protein